MIVLPYRLDLLHWHYKIYLPNLVMDFPAKHVQFQFQFHSARVIEKKNKTKKKEKRYH